jgi:hypothetical protein
MRSASSILMGALIALLAAAAPGRADDRSQPSPGMPGSWRMIGHTQASHSAEHDTITVTGPYDDFRRIKFKVTDAPLNLQRLEITYENGDKDALDVQQAIPQGAESRVIDLRGGSRHIRKIEFWYDTRGKGQGKSDVTVFGMK